MFQIEGMIKIRFKIVMPGKSKRGGSKLIKKGMMRKMDKRRYGYVRVSARDQHTDRQMAAMKKERIAPDHIYVDRQSGKDFNRPQYRKLVNTLKKGDIVYVKSIDRLGRNYDEIIDQWRKLVHELQVDIVVIDFPLLDTREKGRDLTGKFIADMVLQILCYVAQIERENIKQRQKEGIAAAREKGIQLGRPNKKIPEEFHGIYEKWKSKKISGREAARRLHVAQRTFLKWAYDCQGFGCD